MNDESAFIMRQHLQVGRIAAVMDMARMVKLPASRHMALEDLINDTMPLMVGAGNLHAGPLWPRATMRPEDGLL
jgi:hypothetical protein